MGDDGHKKNAERNFVRELKQKLLDFPDGEIIDHDSPDFLIQHSSGTLGVEVTRLFQKTHIGHAPRKAQESERQWVVDYARQIYEQGDMPPIQVHVSFDGSSLISKANRVKLARQLTNVVIHELPPEDTWRELRNDYKSLRGNPDCISEISIVRAAVLTRNTWSVPDGGFVAEDFITDIQEVIDDKNAHYPRYRRECDQCWLLVVAEGRSPSTFFQAGVTTVQHSYHSRYDRTYYLEGFSQRLIKLNTSGDRH